MDRPESRGGGSASRSQVRPELTPFIRRLEQHGPLTEEEKGVLQEVARSTKSFRAREEIVREGSRPTHSSLLLEGFAVREAHLEDGSRQISAFHIPGDFADLHAYLLKRMNEGVGAITPAKVALVAHSDLDQITKSYPHLARILWFTTLVDGAVHRAWLTTLGRMEAPQRLAHFLCELRDRLASVGLAEGNSYVLPMTQEELGDAFGLSTVHVNRSLKTLRDEGLITSKGRHLRIEDWEALRQAGQYDPGYLHLGVQVSRC